MLKLFEGLYSLHNKGKAFGGCRLSGGKKGITLIETVISIMVLALTLGAMLGTFVIGRAITASATNRIQAQNFARSGMEWSATKSCSELKTLLMGEGDVDILPYLSFSSDFSISNNLTNAAVVASGRLDAGSNLEVTVKASWTEPAFRSGGFASEEMVTLVSKWRE